jgi:hypothetical protein
MLLEGTKVFVVPGFNPEEAERFPKNPFSLVSVRSSSLVVVITIAIIHKWVILLLLHVFNLCK